MDGEIASLTFRRITLALGILPTTTRNTIANLMQMPASMTDVIMLNYVNLTALSLYRILSLLTPPFDEFLSYDLIFRLFFMF